MYRVGIRNTNAFFFFFLNLNCEQKIMESWYMKNNLYHFQTIDMRHLPDYKMITELQIIRGLD